MVAAFTVILAIATWYLWWATRGLVRGAERTAERQLRAYITVTIAEIRGLQDGVIPQGHVGVRNSGQTPGYDVWSYSIITFDEFPPRLPFDLRGEQMKERGGGGTIGSLGEHHLARSLPAPLTQAQFDEMQTGKAAIYYFDYTRYRDAFNHQRRTNFRFYYGADLGMTPNGAFWQLPEGNEAD